MRLIIDPQRLISDLSSTKISSNYETTLELDSHADTCVLGCDALILHDYLRPVSVQGYDPALGTTQYNTVSGALAYDHPHSGETFHLVVNQAIHIPHLDHHLLCPMQCRVNDVIVNETPKFLAQDLTEHSHALTVQDPINPVQTVILPLALRGVTSLLNVRAPTLDEWNSNRFTRLHLTSETLTWDPTTSHFEEQEASMTDYAGKITPRIGERGRGDAYVINSLCSLTTDLVDVTDDDNFHTALLSNVQISSVETSLNGNIRSRKTPHIDPMTLSARWMIPPERAKRTVANTTQRGVRTCVDPTLSRRFPTNDRMLRYPRLMHTVFTDTMFASTVSRQGNKMAQVYATSFGWARAYPMKRKGEAHETLSLVFHRDGVPPTMVTDDSKEQTKGEFRRKLKEADCHPRVLEPYSPWQQAAEGCIRELKRGTSRKMIKTGSPKTLWDHCLELEALVRSNSSNDIYMTNGQVPETIIKGTTADISHIAEFGWYDWVMFRDNTPTFPDDRLVLGRYLGPATDMGSALTAKILKENGQFVCRSTLRHLTQQELQCPVHTATRLQFDASIRTHLGNPATAADFPAEDLTPDPDHFDESELLNPDAGDAEVTPEVGDNLLNAEVMLPRAGVMKKGRVAARKRDYAGNPVGLANPNPILDTRSYIVDFDDGDQAELTANLIAESIYSQCDPDGNQYVLLDGFIDHRRLDNAIKLADQKVVRPNGRTYMKRSTIGWQLCCQWKDGSTSWENLVDLKESHPVETAEYAKIVGIDHEPAFNWWVPHVLTKRDRIISLVKQRKPRYLKRTHKFGIELPKTVNEALELDRKNGNTLWSAGIAKEMQNVRVAFKILSDDESIPIGYQKIPCHMVFDIKMEDFTRKARLVAGGHKTDAPATITYASVVSRETVRIALLMAALNDLEVKAGDVLNAYVTAPVTEKVWTILGPEFGPDAGKNAIIVRALYGLKSSGAAFRAHLASFMRQMGYTSCKADPDLWYKAETRPDDNFRYYSYILCYVDDILCIHHNAMTVLDQINKYLPLKPTSVGDPDIYLGAKLRKTRLANDVLAWSLSPSKYVAQAVKNCEKHLTEKLDGKYSLPSEAPNPFPYDCCPELDTSDPLDPEGASFYQHLIGVMRWMVELGRVDIAVKVSLLSSHLAYPREGHLELALHIMGYLRLKHNTRLVFDPTYPTINYSLFPDYNWTEFYGDVQEAIPHDMPEPLGKDVDVRMMCDSDHAGEKRTRRSRTGFLIFCNMALIDWVSKRQPTIETSVFGAEFVAMKHGIEKLRGLRYKLRMMGIPLVGPSYIFGDNKSQVTNSTQPESTLKRKCNSICYHFIRESVAMGESAVTHLWTGHNSSDLMTKVTYGAKRRRLVGGILYDIYDDHPKQ